jgi:hypothetical protein
MLRPGRAQAEDAELLRSQGPLLVDGQAFDVGAGFLKKEKLPQGVTYEQVIAQQYHAVELGIQAIEARKADRTTEAEARENEAKRMREGAMPLPTRMSDPVATTSAEHVVSSETRLLVKFTPDGMKTVRRQYRIEGGKLIVIKTPMVPGLQKMLTGEEQNVAKHDLSDCAHVEGYELEKNEPGARLRVKFEVDPKGKPYPARVWVMPDKQWRTGLRNGKEYRDKRYYLYCKDVEEAEALQAQIRMSKYMSDPQKQGSFRRAVQRIMAQKMSMTVDSVIAGYNTVNDFRSVIKRFIGNLLHSDLARGWKKWRLLHQVKVKEKAALANSKEWASRFMTDALFANRQMQVKSADEVRQEVITAMQKAFKRMRRARLMAGGYAFPHGTPSRMERAREGLDVILGFQGLSRIDVFKLCCDENFVNQKYVSVDVEKAGISRGFSHTMTMSARKTKTKDTKTADEAIRRFSFLHEYVEAVEKEAAVKPHATLFEGEAAYSASDADSVVPIARGMIHFSDNLSMVKFCVGKPGGKEHNQLNKAEHSYFVQSETISCVIVNAEHYNANKDDFVTVKAKKASPIAMASSAETTSGYWVTICGPRVAFGRKMDKRENQEEKKGSKLVGIEVLKGHESAADFGADRDLFSMTYGFLRLSITVSTAKIKDLFKSRPKEEQAKLVGKKTKVRFSFLGQTTESSLEEITEVDGTVGPPTGTNGPNTEGGYNTDKDAEGVVYVPYFKPTGINNKAEVGERVLVDGALATVRWFGTFGPAPPPDATPDPSAPPAQVWVGLDFDDVKRGGKAQPGVNDGTRPDGKKYFNARKETVRLENGETVTYSSGIFVEIEKLERSDDLKVYDSSHCVFDVIEVSEEPDVADKIIGTYECFLDTLVDFMFSGTGNVGLPVPRSGVPAVKLAKDGKKDFGTNQAEAGTLSKLIQLAVPDCVKENKLLKAPTDAFIRVTLKCEEITRDHMKEVQPTNCKSSDARMPVSPAAIGTGTSSTLFTTHKGAYFDGRKGPGKFSVDHVGNCLEVFVKSFHLQDKPDNLNKGLRYYAVVRCGSAVRTTPAYVRPPYESAGEGSKTKWSKVVSDADAKTVMMLHTIYVPLPPETIAGDDSSSGFYLRDSVEIELWSLYLPEPTAMTYAEAFAKAHADTSTERVKFFGNCARPSPEPMVAQCLGCADLLIDKMMVGDERTLDNLRVATKTLDTPKPQYDGYSCALLSNPAPKSDCPFMNISYALRDKDLSKIDERRDVFNIGDGVILPVEENVESLLPRGTRDEDKTDLDGKAINKKKEQIKYRKLFAPEFTDEHWKRKVLPLRLPCLRSELDLSGMEGIQNYFFKQRAIPDYCDDPVPHQYIIARNEKDHERRGCQGSYFRVMNEMAALGESKKDGQGRVVDSLSHLTRGFNCTVVALYANRTAVLEISEDNDDLRRWKEGKGKLLFPGGEIEFMPSGGLRLHGVHLSQLRSLECGGFSVYDAKLPASISLAGNQENLNKMTLKAFRHEKPMNGPSANDKKIASGYGVVAGPMPIDANPYVSTYEWTFSVQLETEHAMYDFVEALRSASRTSADTVKRQMLDAISRPKGDQVFRDMVDGSVQKGNVEIVIMEATRLRDPHAVSMLRHPAAQMVSRKVAEVGKYGLKQSTFVLNPVVKMAIKCGDKRLFNPQEVPKIKADSNRARWSEIKELKELGGYTLRTPVLDLTKDEHLTAHLEFKISNRMVDNVVASDLTDEPIATAMLPVADLMNVDAPFQQHILELEGTEKGELYIMTRYAVSKPQALRLDLSTASEYLNHQLRVAQEVRSRFKCPPPDLALLYNANLAQQGPAYRPASRSGEREIVEGSKEKEEMLYIHDPSAYLKRAGKQPQMDGPGSGELTENLKRKIQYAAAFSPCNPAKAWEVELEFKKAMLTCFARDDGYAHAVCPVGGAGEGDAGKRRGSSCGQGKQPQDRGHVRQVVQGWRPGREAPQCLV